MLTAIHPLYVAIRQLYVNLYVNLYGGYTKAIRRLYAFTKRLYAYTARAQVAAAGSAKKISA